MGLHIYAYDECILNTPVNEEEFDYSISEYPNIQSLSASVFDFRAGSYSGYNNFRENLAKFAGYPEIDYIDFFGVTKKLASAYCWENATSGLFYELINFSDCEGTISTEKCKKLYNDFHSNLEKAELYFNDWDICIYKNFLTAFQIAAEQGCVVFS